MKARKKTLADPCAPRPLISGSTRCNGTAQKCPSTATKPEACGAEKKRPTLKKEKMTYGRCASRGNGFQEKIRQDGDGHYALAPLLPQTACKRIPLSRTHYFSPNRADHPAINKRTIVKIAAPVAKPKAVRAAPSFGSISFFSSSTAWPVCRFFSSFSALAISRALAA